MPSDSGTSWSPPASTERRLSNSSDGSAGSGYSKATSDSADFLATRPHTAAVIPGKPAANPLQFVKVGPADLGTRAREQLRRAELAKRTEPARIERQEDWQSNLDNWKSSRRKRVEHIIERCVEVKRLEHEVNQPRGKSKTFNEMLEERSGRRRRNHLAVYTDDDAHDLSDLGIGTSSTKSSLSEDCDTHSLASDGMDLDKNHSDMDNMSNYDGNRKMGSSANEYDTCTTTTISSPEPEEYTYEGAIEGYKSRIISTTNSNIVKTVVNNNSSEKSPDKSNGDNIHKIRTSVSNKIEEKLISFQQERSNDLRNNNPKKDLPKVDIHKRREQFERENSLESQVNKSKLPDIHNKRSIKERLSSLEKFTEENQVQKSTGDLTKLPTEAKPLKERLSCLEKVKATEPEKVKRLSNGDLSNAKSLRERLSSLKSQTSVEDVKVTKTEVSVSLKERLSCLEAAKNKEIPRVSIEEQLNKASEDSSNNLDAEVSDNSLKASLSGIENQMQSFCRSLDSLDVNDQRSPNSFERVQSLEEFDCADMQNNTIPSDIETEDSGIHTARDSCAPADDIADLTQVASPIGEAMVEVSEYESSNEDGLILGLKIHEPTDQVNELLGSNNKDLFIEEVYDDNKEDTDSASNYTQALSHPEELSVTDEVTEIQVDKEDEDTLKSLENQDSSVSLNEQLSSASDGDAVVFEGKMIIHLNLNDICNNLNSGVGDNASQSSANNSNSNNSTNKSMPMVTVSNITTTTNISPKNSIKTFRVLEQSSHINKPINVVSSRPSEHCNVGNHEVAQLSHLPSTINICMSNETRNIPSNAANDDDAVMDALELAFKELDSEESTDITMSDNDKLDDSKIETRTNRESEIDFDPNKRVSVTPLYENIDIFGQNNVVDAGEFPLDLPTNVLEPPKEKPPPPPAEDSPEDELLGNGNFKHTNSARRIKKEIRNKRTSFLGIEGQDDSYLDVDLTLAPRPDITSFLQEETKIEKLLYKKTLSHDMDAKLRDSRDSGVDIDRGPSAEAWYKGSSPETSAPHSRQNSEPYTQITVTSDEEESLKKKEQTFAKDLSDKLSDLPNVSHDKIDHLDKKLQQQQAARINDDWQDGHFDDVHTKEVLRFERELLQLEQEELRRQKENLLRDQQRIIQKSIQDISIASTPEKHGQRSKGIENYRHSMPNLLLAEHNPIHHQPPPLLEKPVIDESLKRKPFVSEEHIESHFGVEESRKVLYDDRSKYERRHVPNVMRPTQQPVLPPKPKSRESIEREITMRSSRTPSAVEYANIDRNGVHLRQKPVNAPNGQYHPMTRHTLQALSAAPTPKLISNTEWMQTRNLPRQKPPNYNYNQHWLVQEAEHRRIEEQRNKICNRHSYHEPAPPRTPPAQLHPPAHNVPLIANSQQTVKERRPIRPDMGRDRTETGREDKLLSVSGRRKCSHCGEELGRGAAMIIESLSLCYHVWCFRCAVCGGALGDGRAGADVRVRNHRLHCHHCYSTDDGDKYSRV